MFDPHTVIMYRLFQEQRRRTGMFYTQPEGYLNDLGLFPVPTEFKHNYHPDLIVIKYL